MLTKISHRIKFTACILAVLMALQAGTYHSAFAQSDDETPVTVEQVEPRLEAGSEDLAESDSDTEPSEVEESEAEAEPEEAQATDPGLLDGHSLLSIEPAESPVSDNTAFQTSLFTGSASYSYPISVPPGTHGLQPQLALSYTSTDSGRAGIAGLGWDLTTSYVSRDARYTVADLAPVPGEGDDTYRLVLNGQSHELIYIASEARFHTKIESDLFIQYIRTGGANEYGGYWIVKDKSGTIYRFGYNANSEARCTNRAYAFRWSLDEVTDTNNNHIYLGYNEGLSSQDLGAVYPAWMEYNNDRTRRVEFVYEAGDRPDRPIIYEAGCRTRYARRLSQIRTYVANSFVHAHVLGYNTNGGWRSHLVTIQELDRNGNALPATWFGYQPETRAWATTHQIWAPAGTPFLFDDDDRNQNVEMHDVNRDGLVDIVHGDNEWKVYLNTGNSWQSEGQTWLNEAGNELGELDTVLVDVTSDGLPDIVENEANNVYVNINNGNGWNTKVTWNWPSGSSSLDLDNPLSPDHQQPLVEFGDVNGDGLPDFYEGGNEDSGGTTWRVSTQNGNGWNVLANWPVTIKQYIQERDTIVIDVNGDGLQDILDGNEGSPAEWWVSLNRGNGWEAQEMWFQTSDSQYNLIDPETTMSDVNGDGFVDIVESANNGFWDVNPNRGNGWSGITQWPAPDARYAPGVVLADANGDGYPDIIQREGGVGWKVWLNQGNQSNLLTSIRNRYGGTISIEYTRSTRFDNTGPDNLSDLGFNTWVVSRITRNNGLTGAQQVIETTNYSYEGGLHDYPDREFRGFNKVVETDATGNTVTHYFHQDDALKGLEYRTEVQDAVGRLYNVAENTYSSTPQGTGYVVRLTRTDESTFDGSAGSPVVRRTEYQYDPYGNMTLTSYRGDPSVIGDERFAYTQHTYNTTKWIVDRLAHTYLMASDNSTVIRESWLYYDGNTIWSDPPTKGNLTLQTNVLDTGDDPSTRYEYDSYGNQILITDPLGRVTEFVYGIADPTFTFPEKVINPLGQQIVSVFDRATGNVLSTTDANGYVTQYIYDAEGRLADEIRPYDSVALPTVRYEYQLDGVAPEVIVVRQRTISGQLAMLGTWTIVDGFGRVLQTRAPAEDAAKQIVTNTYYNNRGLAHIQSVPHFDTFIAAYAQPVAGIRSTSVLYDALSRETQVTNPDGTSRTMTYDHYRTDLRDENGHVKRQATDAYGNIIRVDEYIDGQYQLTHYTYSAANELLRIVDAVGNAFVWTYDSLGRQLTLDDPDMGTWTYGYDLVGNVVRQTDARGVAVVKTYDALNRPLKLDYPTQTDVIYTYDQGVIGTLSSVQDAAGTVSHTFDQRLRQTGETRTIGSLTWTTQVSYDALDRVTSITYPTGEVVTFGFNGQGQIESVSGLITNYDYDAFQRITRKVFANGLTTVYTYDLDDFRLKTIQTPGVQDLAYEYDAVGNVLAITNNRLGVTETFTYDELDRLLTATEPEGYRHRYTYNAIGNILSVETDELLATYSYGANAGPHAVTSVVRSWLVPTNPVPAHGATGVSLSAQLCWDAVSDSVEGPVTYDVYFGPNSAPPLAASGQGSTCYTPGGLQGNTVYYWKVAAKYGQGIVKTGPVWSFTTASAATWTPANIGTGLGTTTENGGDVTISASGGDIFGTADGFHFAYDEGSGNVELVARVRSWTPGSSTAKAGIMLRRNTTAGSPHVLVHVTSNNSTAGGVRRKARLVQDDNTTANLTLSNNMPPVWLKLRKVGNTITVYYSVNGSSWTQESSSVTLNLGANFLVGLAVSSTTGATAIFDNVTVTPLGENNPPTTPSNPIPAHGVTDAPADGQVCWTAGSDPDGDAVTYDVAFGTANPPPAATSGQSATCYDPPGNLTPNTNFYWQVTAKDAFGGATAGPVWSFVTAHDGGAFPNFFYLSPSASVTIGGIAAQGADVLRYTRSTNSWTMLFDGSDHSLTKNISAFALTDDGSLLFVLAANQAIAGLGTVTPFDVVKFTPNAPGVFPLGAGTYSWFLQGRPKGLTTTAEKIDAIDLAGNRLLLSTFGLASVPKPGGGVLKPADEDVFAFNLSTNVWESTLVIDGSKMPGMGVEDINSIWDDPQSSDYYVTILGPFNLGGLAGNDKGIVKLTPNGGASVYTPSLVSWLAAGATLPTGFKIDGIEIAR